MNCPNCGAELERTTSGTFVTCPKGDSKLVPVKPRRGRPKSGKPTKREQYQAWKASLPRFTKMPLPNVGFWEWVSPEGRGSRLTNRSIDDYECSGGVGVLAVGIFGPHPWQHRVRVFEEA